MRLSFNKKFEVRSGKDYEYDLNVRIVGESNLIAIKEQEQEFEEADLDDNQFGFFYIEVPSIRNINYSIVKANIKKGKVNKNKFRALPKEAKEAGLKKIKRFISKYKNFEEELKKTTEELKK